MRVMGHAWKVCLAHLMLLLLLLLGDCLVAARPQSSYPSLPPIDAGIAFAFTGAGGRIGQLDALAQALINGSYPRRPALRPSYITGVSSGALISVAVSAVLEASEQNGTAGFTFAELDDTVFNLKNADVYSANIYKVIDNVDDGFLLDTSPLKAFLAKMLARISYTNLGDLYVPTIISVVDQRTGANIRLSSLNPAHASLSLLDVLLSSTAIPIAFKPGTIPGLSKYSQFLDGATGVDSAPVIPLISLPSIHTIYVITYNYAITRGVVDELKPFNPDERTMIKYALRAFDIQLSNLALAGLYALVASNVTGYVYEPNFTASFSTIDFESGRQQFALAAAWASKSDPIPVETYLLRPVFSPNYTDVDDHLINAAVYYRALHPLLFAVVLLSLYL